MAERYPCVTAKKHGDRLHLYVFGLRRTGQFRQGAKEMRKRSRRAGFTLIELLVVISIIAVLAAIVMPVYKAAQERANQADCMSHLHAIGVAMKLYHGDHHRYPGHVTPDPVNVGRHFGGITALCLSGALTSTKGVVCKDDSSALAETMAAGEYLGPGVTSIYSSYNVDPSGHPVYNYWGLKGDGTAILTEAAIPTASIPDDMPGPLDSMYPACKNPNAPDETIVTHCTHHRTATGTRRLDMVLHLGGDVTKEPSGSTRWMAWWNF